MCMCVCVASGGRGRECCDYTQRGGQLCHVRLSLPTDPHRPVFFLEFENTRYACIHTFLLQQGICIRKISLISSSKSSPLAHGNCHEHHHLLMGIMGIPKRLCSVCKVNLKTPWANSDVTFTHTVLVGMKRIFGMKCWLAHEKSGPLNTGIDSHIDTVADGNRSICCYYITLLMGIRPLSRALRSSRLKKKKSQKVSPFNHFVKLVSSAVSLHSAWMKYRKWLHTV